MNTHVYVNGDKTLAMGPNGMVALTTDSMGSKTLHPVEDLRGRRCYLCQQYWDLSAESYLDHVRLDNGLDVHRSCFRRCQTLNDNREWDKILQANSIPYHSSALVKNPYSDERPDRVLYDLGHDWRLKLMVGCRKNVNEIRFYQMPFDLFWSVARAFEDWPHTSGNSSSAEDGPFVYVHTWVHEDIDWALQRWRECVIAAEKAADLPLAAFDERRGWLNFISFDAHLTARGERASAASKEAARAREATATLKEMEAAIKKAMAADPVQ